MRLDLHMHPLCHEYYNGVDIPHNVKQLTDVDRERVRDMLAWNVTRGMDVVAITDHDMVLPSLYAMEYAKGIGLPITVVTGTEIELHRSFEDRRMERIHLCAWGVKEQPQYARCTPVEEMVDRIHSMGGIVIMNHPEFSLRSFRDYYEIMDGYEYWNGGCGYFTLGKEFLDHVAKFELKEYYNSDCHYDPYQYALPKDPKYFPPVCNEWDDEYGKEWLKKLGIEPWQNK